MQILLVERSRGTTFLPMGERRDSGDHARTVTRADLMKDTRAVVQRAEREGPVVVTDDKGTTRMVIHCPRDKRPFNDD